MKNTTVLLACVFAFVFSVTAAAQWGSGWQIPAGAEREVSPVKPSAEVVKLGKSIFDSHCARCHGPEGKGDGKESDPNNPAADLTDSFRADLNPDGVMFHRVSNGKPPFMPAFKSELSGDEIWTVVQVRKVTPQAVRAGVGVLTLFNPAITAAARHAPGPYNPGMCFDDYKIVLYRQADGAWVAEIPALGGCYALMDTREAALAELEQVFAMIAQEHHARGQALPKDTTEVVHA